MGWFGARMCSEGTLVAGKYVPNVPLTSRCKAGMCAFNSPVRSYRLSLGMPAHTHHAAMALASESKLASASDLS